jgi:translation initiation factor IF-1
MLGHALLVCGTDVSQPKRDRIVTGRIIEPLPNSLFLVELEDGREITAHLSGRVRTQIVRILPGDRVHVEVSAFDLARGRIVDRLRTS